MHPRSDSIQRLELVGLLLCFLVLIYDRAWAEDEFELPPLSYSATEPNDAVTRLRRNLGTHPDLLKAPSDKGFLERLIEELHVPKESQMLVFSKTSLQRERIHPSNPRAIFFSDDAYVGWVPGGDIEITSFDPVLGAIYYRVSRDSRSDKKRVADFLVPNPSSEWRSQTLDKCHS